MRAILMVFVLAAVAVLAYNYGAGRGLALPGPGTSRTFGIDGDRVRDTVRDAVRDTARETGADIVDQAKAHATTIAHRTEDVVTEAALTGKIKAKMALDDVVKVSHINVDTSGSQVTLTGDVASREEQQRALRIARETDGVKGVVDHLRVR